MVVGCVWAWSTIDIQLSRRWRRTVAVGIAGWVLIVLGVRAIEPPARFLAGQLRPSVLPHLRGVFVPTEQDDAVRQDVERLKSYDDGGVPMTENGLAVLIIGGDWLIRRRTPWVLLGGFVFVTVLYGAMIGLGSTDAAQSWALDWMT